MTDKEVTWLVYEDKEGHMVEKVSCGRSHDRHM